MTTEASNENTPLNISTLAYGSIKSVSKGQPARALEAPEATLQDDARSQDLEDRGNIDIPSSWDDHENAENPLNWSPWWKYSIIALVSFIELLTKVHTFR